MSDDRALEQLRHWRLEADASQPPYRQFASFVHDSVVRGELGAGTVLPPERELAALTGLGRATIARALRELADTGLLERRVGRGTVVAFDAHNWQAGPTAGIAWGALLTTLVPGPAGPRPLTRRREQIARTLDVPDRDADTVLPTASIEDGTRFLVAALVRAGERIVVETPASSALATSLAMRGAEVLEVAGGAEFTSELERLLDSGSGAKLLWLRASSTLRRRGDRAHVAGVTKRLGMPVIEEPPSVRSQQGLLEVEPHDHVIRVGDGWISVPSDLATSLSRLAASVGLGAASDG